MFKCESSRRCATAACATSLLLNFGAVLAQPDSQTELPAYATLHDGSQNKESIPMPEAILALFTLVVSLEEDRAGSGSEFLEHTVGLPRHAADSLFHYIRSALDANRRRGVELNAQMCSRRESVATRADLTREIVEMERSHRQDLELRTYGISEAVSIDDAQKVLAWVDEHLRPSIKMVSFDREKQVATLDPRDAISRMCDKPEEPQVSRGN